MNSSASRAYSSKSRSFDHQITQQTTIEANRPALSREELEAVLQCLIEDQIGSGRVTERLEKALAESAGQKKTLVVNSLVAAYHLSFLSLITNDKTTVWINALSSVAVLDAARYTDAKIRLLDAGRDSFHPTSETVEMMLQEAKPGDIFVYDHVYGSPVPFSTDLLQDKGLKIIEDITAMVGSTYADGSAFGQSADIVVCGMAEDDIITTGNGAFITSANAALLKTMTSMRYGTGRDLHSVAYDYQVEDFQAAIGLHQLSRLGQMVSRRKKIGIKYLESIKLTKHSSYFTNPGPDSYYKMPVTINRPQDEVLRYFKTLHIGVQKIPTPLHHYLGLAPMEFPNAERLFRRSVCVPVYPVLTANNVERIAGSLRNLI